MDPPVGRLTITNRRERALVGAVDLALAPLGLFRGTSRRSPPRRILCLRLERIGDLLMTLPALARLRAAAPDATIDLAVGSWNADIARIIPGVDHVDVLDAAWLARGSGGLGTLALMRRAGAWRARRYDLAINFEPDIRSNLILAATGAARRAGCVSGGGGPVLDIALDYDVHAHTADTAVALVDAAVGTPATSPAPLRLAVPDSARNDAAGRLRHFPGPIAAVHVSGGRAIKQWPEERFREVATILVRERGMSIVLTGAPADRAQVDTVKAALPDDRVLDVSGAIDLVALAAILERVDLLVTGDTGPMHLAHAVGTPIVAIFGPSDPVRYAPRGLHDRVVRIDLPCAPCNRIRQPPARCVGHTPDCLAGVGTAQVLRAIDDVIGLAGRDPRGERRIG
jgi:ADP-heptose:LPS heptosyltransferase